MTSENHQAFPFAVYAPYIMPTQPFPYVYGSDLLLRCDMPVTMPPFAAAGILPRAVDADHSALASTNTSTAPMTQTTGSRGAATQPTSSPGFQLTVLHKPRGSQGSWVPIENEQRVRVTSVRGKNIRVLIRSAQPVDWATLRLSLWERPVERTTEQYERGDDARSFSIETRAITEEIDRNSGPLPKTFFVFQADVKLYTIHRSCIFKAEIQTRPDTGELVAFGPEMITHNSGRRDTTDNIKKRPSTTEDMVMLPPSSKRSRPGSDERPYARSSSQASSPTSSTSFVESPVGWQQDDTLVPGNFGSINEIPAPQQTATLPSFSSLMLPARFATLPPLPASLIAPIPRAAPMSHPSPSLLHSSSPSSHADTTDDMDTDETQENMVFMLESLRSKARQYSESSNGPSAFSARISPSTQRRGVGY